MFRPPELQLTRLKDRLASGIRQAEQGEVDDYSYDALMADVDREVARKASM